MGMAKQVHFTVFDLPLLHRSYFRSRGACISATEMLALEGLSWFVLIQLQPYKTMCRIGDMFTNFIACAMSGPHSFPEYLQLGVLSLFWGGCIDP